MKPSYIRFGILCLTLSLLCVAAITQYNTANREKRERSVMVMAYYFNK